jgi:hypothetical protein
MTPDIAIRSVLALFALWVVVYYFWRDFRLDVFREDIFSVRDRMFLYAAKGNISFNHPAYTILRNRMNVLLRHGHEFTLTRMVFVLLTHGNTNNEAVLQWEAAVEGLPERTQASMRDFNLSVVIFVLQHLVFFSFFRYMMIRPLMFLVKISWVIESPKVVSGVEQLESHTQEQEARLLDRAAAADHAATA